MRPRVLYITHRVPFPPDRGDRIRTWNVLRYLSSRANVDLICLADEPASEATMNELHRVTKRLAVIPHSGNGRYFSGLVSLAAGKTVTEGLFRNSVLKAVVREWDRLEKYTAVLASSSGVAGYLCPPDFCQPATRWVDLIDVDSQKWLDYSSAARFPVSLVYRTESHRLRRVEQSLAQNFDRLLVVSPAERELFLTFCPTAKISAVGNGVDSQYFSPAVNSPVDPHTCIFVGVMNYKPNVDAVVWFANQVWPQIRQRYSDAEFRIVGKSPATEVSALSARPGIVVTGAVPDVRPWLYQSACAVVPLQIARGVQNKVLEAMSCGRPVICSPAPLKGLGAEPGLHLLEADNAEEWLTAVSRVFDDPVLWQDLSMAGAAWVQLHHSWDHCLSELDQILEQPPRKAASASEVIR